MKVLVADRKAQCSKPDCLGQYTHRHHKGCETMWLKAFHHLRKTKKYKALIKRYYKFRPRDVVEICDNHHEEIHFIYNALIATEVRRKCKPTSAWTWAEAEVLMKILRAKCDEWLKVKTPGLPLKKFQRAVAR